MAMASPVEGKIDSPCLVSALRLGARVRDEEGVGDRVPAVPALLRDRAGHQVCAAVQPDLRREMQHGVHQALQDAGIFPVEGGL